MYILNDYSIDNQFSTVDEFLDSLLNHTIPLFQTMDKYNIELIKSYDIFELKVANDLSFLNILSIKGYPEITKFSSLLHKRLMDNPYWEKDFDQQDCFNKAYQMNTGLISFEHDQYLGEYIEYQFDNQDLKISNTYNSMQLYERLEKEGTISSGEYLVNKYKNIYTFCNIGGMDYFKDFILENDIKVDEVDKILEDIKDFMERYNSNSDLGSLSKNLETNLHEFRTTISGSRKVRILYCIHDSKIAFLNCFIKKQQKTPEREKELGRKLRDLIC